MNSLGSSLNTYIGKPVYNNFFKPIGDLANLTFFKSEKCKDIEKLETQQKQRFIANLNTCYKYEISTTLKKLCSPEGRNSFGDDINDWKYLRLITPHDLTDIFEDSLSSLKSTEFRNWVNNSPINKKVFQSLLDYLDDQNKVETQQINSTNKNFITYISKPFYDYVSKPAYDNIGKPIYDKYFKNEETSGILSFSENSALNNCAFNIRINASEQHFKCIVNEIKGTQTNALIIDIAIGIGNQIFVGILQAAMGNIVSFLNNFFYSPENTAEENREEIESIKEKLYEQLNIIKNFVNTKNIELSQLNIKWDEIRTQITTLLDMIDNPLNYKEGDYEQAIEQFKNFENSLGKVQNANLQNFIIKYANGTESSIGNLNLPISPEFNEQISSPNVNSPEFQESPTRWIPTLESPEWALFTADCTTFAIELLIGSIVTTIAPQKYPNLIRDYVNYAPSFNLYANGLPKIAVDSALTFFIFRAIESIGKYEDESRVKFLKNSNQILQNLVADINKYQNELPSKFNTIFQEGKNQKLKFVKDKYPNPKTNKETVPLLETTTGDCTNYQGETINPLHIHTLQAEETRSWQRSILPKAFNGGTTEHYCSISSNQEATTVEQSGQISNPETRIMVQGNGLTGIQTVETSDSSIDQIRIVTQENNAYISIHTNGKQIKHETSIIKQLGIKAYNGKFCLTNGQIDVFTDYNDDPSKIVTYTNDDGTSTPICFGSIINFCTETIHNSKKLNQNSLDIFKNIIGNTYENIIDNGLGNLQSYLLNPSILSIPLLTNITSGNLTKIITTTLAPDNTMYLDAINTGINNMTESIANELQNFPEQLYISEITSNLPSDHFQTQDQTFSAGGSWVAFCFISLLCSMSLVYCICSNKESNHIKGVTHEMNKNTFNNAIKNTDLENLDDSNLVISEEEKPYDNIITTNSNLETKVEMAEE